MPRTSKKASKATEKPKNMPRISLKKPSMEQARRQRINQLYKRKRAIFAKACRLAKICNQKVLVAVYDPRLRKFTQFSSDETFDIPHIVKASTDAEVKIKNTKAKEIEDYLMKRKNKGRSITVSDDSPDLSASEVNDSTSNRQNGG